MKNRNKPCPNTNTTEEPAQTTTTTTTTTTPIEKRFIVLPNKGDKSEDFAKRLESLITKSYPQIEFNVAFITPNEICKMFPFHSKTISNMQKTDFSSYTASNAKIVTNLT